MTITVHRPPRVDFDKVDCYQPITIDGARHLTWLPAVAPLTGTRFVTVCELQRTVNQRTRGQYDRDCPFCMRMYPPPIQ